jgi:hypothetical protein
VSKFDLGSTGGGIPSVEHDYLYVALRGIQGMNRLHVMRVSDPLNAAIIATLPIDGRTTGLSTMRLYNPPFLMHYVLLPTERGLRIVDVSRSEQPVIQARLDGVGCSGGIEAEGMPLDRMITEEGAQLKDIAHEDARYVNGEELRRLLRAKIPYNEPPEDAPDPKGGRAAPGKRKQSDK